MSTREDIKSLLAKESYTITKIAEKLTEKTGKKYTVKTISQKLTNNTLRYDEYKNIVELLGYDIKLIKKSL